MDISYLKDIKDDVFNMIENESKRNHIFQSCVARVIHENDYYISDEMPTERDCYYIAIGIYTIESDNKLNLADKVKKEIKRSIATIKSGKYDKCFTEEDKKYIYEDIKTIENSDLLK